MSSRTDKEVRPNSGEESRASTSSNFSSQGMNSSGNIENDSTGSSFPQLSEGEEVTPKRKKVTNNASNLSLSCQKFMFDSEMPAAYSARMKKERQKRHISFSPLSQYVELVTFDPTCREADEILNIYVRTGFPTAQIFERSMKMNYHRLEDADEAERYWKTIVPAGAMFQEPIVFDKEEVERDFEYRVRFIEDNWSHGLPFEDDIEHCIDQMLFPEANREMVEEQNYELMESILSVLPLDRHRVSLNIQKMCEVFTNYVSLTYLIGMLNNGSFKAKMCYILSHQTLDVEHEHYHWELGKRGIERVLSLFEAEQDTFEAVPDAELFKIGQLNDAVLGTLNCRVLTKVIDDDDDTESFFGLGNAFRLNTEEDKAETYFDLISKQFLKIARRSIDNRDLYDDDVDDISDQESTSELFYEVTSEKFITNPSPIVVPHNWQDFDLLAFLMNPWNSWNTAKMIFLGSYFDLLNQMMVSACINNNIMLLNTVRSRPLPDAFKTKLLAHCSFAENSKLGTVQLAVYKPNTKKKKTRKSTKRYLAVNSSSFYLNPLVRADLYFSYTQHCLLNQPCTGHKGLLLLYMLRMGRRDIAELLMQDGVSVNYKVCSLPARSITYKEELNTQLSGVITQKQKKERKMSPDDKETKALLKKYVSDSGILEDNYIRLVAKSTKYTPFAAAVEAAVESGDNETVNALLAERGARVARADFCSFKALLPFLREVAGRFLSRKVKKKKKSKRFSLLPRRRSKVGSKDAEEGLKLLNTHVPLSVVEELQTEKSNVGKLELVLLLLRAAKEELPQMDETSKTVYLKSVLLHICLMSEEWNIVRFLVQRNFDEINKRALQYTLDIILYDLIKGDYPFAGTALNGIYFLLQEFDIFPTFDQVQRLMLIFAEGMLNLPFLPAAASQPIKLIFASKQLQYFFDFFGKHEGQVLATKDFVFLEPFEEDVFEAHHKIIEAIRFELCLGLYKKNFIEAANSLVTNELKSNSVFLNDVLTVTCLDNSCVDALPSVYELVLPYKNVVKKSLDYVFLSSIHSNGLAMEFIRCGALNADNVCDFFYTLLVQFEGKIPELRNHEIVADFSYIFTLMAVVEFMKTAEVDDVREDIYRSLFEKLRKTHAFWMEGMQYVFDYGKIRQETDLKSDLEAHVEQECQYLISYDPLRSLVSLSNVRRTPIPRRVQNPLRLLSHEFDKNGLSHIL